MSEASVLHIALVLHEDIEYHRQDIVLVGHDLSLQIIHHIFSEIVESFSAYL